MKEEKRLNFFVQTIFNVSKFDTKLAKHGWK